MQPMNRHSMRLPLRAFPLVLVGCLGALSSCQASGPSQEARVHAQRPFISQDTHTTDEKVIQAELGARVWSGHEVEVPLYMRYGLGPQSEFFVGTSPYKDVDNNNVTPDGSGWGDTYVGVRHRLRDKDMYSPAYGFQIQTKLPTGRPKDGLGTGSTDWFGALMANQTYYGFDTTLFYQLGILGEVTQTSTPDSNHEHTLAIQTRKEMDAHVTAFSEVAVEWEPEIDREELTVLAGASFLLDSLTALDLGVRVGIGHDAPDFQVVFGISRALGMLFFPEDDVRASLRR